MQDVARSHGDTRPGPMSRWITELAASSLTPVDLRRFRIRVERIDQLDAHGDECDRQQHEADDDGQYPEVEAQAYFHGHDGDPYYVEGCLDCVRVEIARDADGDRLVVIEMEH